MEASITIGQLLQIITVLGAIWGGYKIIVEIVDRINSKHDQIQKWEEYDQQIKDIKSEQEMMTVCVSAILDGLKQLNCNGEVTKAKMELDEYLIKKAHK